MTGKHFGRGLERRKSRRLSGEGVTGDLLGGTKDKRTAAEASKARVADAHSVAATVHHETTSTSVGTSSYGHTLQRVRSMSDRALANRIRAIERKLSGDGAGTSSSSASMRPASSTGMMSRWHDRPLCLRRPFLAKRGNNRHIHENENKNEL